MVILNKLSEEELKELVTKNKLRFQGKTGQKNYVKAYFVLYKGELQIHFKYGKLYYRFKVDNATIEDEAYMLQHNITNKGEDYGIYGEGVVRVEKEGTIRNVS